MRGWSVALALGSTETGRLPAVIAGLDPAIHSRIRPVHAGGTMDPRVKPEGDKVREAQMLKNTLIEVRKVKNVRAFVWTAGIAFLLVAATFQSNARAERIASSYCITIGVSLEETAALVDRFDDFAQRVGLTFETGNPGGRFYFDSNESEMVALINGMGEFGSVLSHAPLEGKAQSDLLDQLRRFVEEDVTPHYKTTLCNEIEGFSPPVLYNWTPTRT